MMRTKAIILLITASAFVKAQGPEKNWNTFESFLPLLTITLDGKNHEFRLSKDLKENCLSPKQGYESWVNMLVKQVGSSHGTDSIRSLFSFTFNDNGNLELIPNEELMNKMDSSIAGIIKGLESWEYNSSCDSIDIGITSKNLEVFTTVNESAKYPGGMDVFYDYIASNVEYPSEAQAAKIEGRVFVEFIVEQDGSISNIQLIKGIGGGCDEEVIRVIKGMPKWIPGKNDGKPVRQKLIKNILFKKPKKRRKRN